MEGGSPDVLIIGAGPTGLAAALFLAERGVSARLVDQAPAPATTSRAQVINPRSLELLEASGVTAAIRREARPVQGVRFYEGWARLAALDFAELPSRQPMLVLPQARTEALLAERLEGYGIVPERGVAFEDLAQDGDMVQAVLVHPDGRREIVRTPLLLGADGAHSRVRESLGIAFEGSAFPEPWPLYDVRLDVPIDRDHGHVSLLHHGLVFVLCIEGELWRVFGDVGEPLDHLPDGSRVGQVAWRSVFHISHRVAARAVAGRAVLAGDAAHIHSPIGARGMNLGIEDAFVFAACAADTLAGQPGRLGDFDRLRHPIHAGIVARMARLTALARGRPDWVGHLRHYLIPGLTGIAPLAREMREFVSGLDHPVDIG